MVRRYIVIPKFMPSLHKSNTLGCSFVFSTTKIWNNLSSVWSTLASFTKTVTISDFDMVCTFNSRPMLYIVDVKTAVAGRTTRETYEQWLQYLAGTGPWAGIQWSIFKVGVSVDNHRWFESVHGRLFWINWLFSLQKWRQKVPKCRFRKNRKPNTHIQGFESILNIFRQQTRQYQATRCSKY